MSRLGVADYHTESEMSKKNSSRLLLVLLVVLELPRSEPVQILSFSLPGQAASGSQLSDPPGVKRNQVQNPGVVKDSIATKDSRC